LNADFCWTQPICIT